MLKVRLRGGPVLGEVEEWFVSTLQAGDCFMFAGQTLRFEALDAMTCVVTRGGEGDLRVPTYAGPRMPLSTWLAARVRGHPARPETVAAAAGAGAAVAADAASGAPPCRSRTGCWSRPFRAAAAGSSSPTASRDGWRTRRSACW